MSNNSELPPSLRTRRARTTRGSKRRPLRLTKASGSNNQVSPTASIPTRPRATPAPIPQYSTSGKIVVGGLAALGVAGVAYWHYGGHSAERKRRLNNTD